MNNDLARSLYYYRATLVRVVDGDTIDVNIDLGFDYITTRRRLRLLGVDTPERGEPDYTKATEVTKDILGSTKSIIVRTISKDSFGRWLADVWCDDAYLNGILIDYGWIYVD
jgi:micrococcal nuclease